MHSAHRQFVAPHPAQTTTSHHAWLGEVAAAPPSCSLQAAHCIDACQLTRRANPMIEVDCMSGRLCFYAFMQRAMLSAMLLCRELCCIALHSPWHSSGHNFGNIALSIALGIALCPALCSALCFMLNIALHKSHQCRSTEPDFQVSTIPIDGTRSPARRAQRCSARQPRRGGLTPF